MKARSGVPAGYCARPCTSAAVMKSSALALNTRNFASSLSSKALSFVYAVILASNSACDQRISAAGELSSAAG